MIRGYNNTEATFAGYEGPLPPRPIIARSFSVIEQQLPLDSPILTFHAFGARLFEFPTNTIFPAVAIPLYLLMVFVLPYFVTKKRDCKLAMQIWNFLLTILSLAMFVTWITSIYSDIQNYSNPIYYLTCLPGGSLTIGMVPVAAITFMISKYLELVDTLFLILKKKGSYLSSLVSSYYCSRLYLVHVRTYLHSDLNLKFKSLLQNFFFLNLSLFFFFFFLK